MDGNGRNKLLVRTCLLLQSDRNRLECPHDWGSELQKEFSLIFP